MATPMLIGVTRLRGLGIVAVAVIAVEKGSRVWHRGYPGTRGGRRLWHPGAPFFPAADHLFARRAPAVTAELATRLQNAMTRNQPRHRVRAHRVADCPRSIRSAELPCQLAVCDRGARFEFEQRAPHL